uniref:rRNA N-glycosylase n=1 Tax=Chenopodium quinoa TaxID=63459 RepID=A0A803ND67_CHEQI
MKRRLMKQRELLNQMKLKLERWLKNYLRQIEVTELKEKLASLKAKFTLNTPLTQPSLMNWVAATPDGDIDSSNFRDPTTAWQAADGAWHVLIGGKSEFEQMGRKKDGGETSKSVQGKVVEKEDFHPNQVSDKDKFFLDLEHSNAPWELIEMIMSSRFCIGYMGHKCNVKKDMPQLKCGESIDYKEGCFLIVTLCLGENFLVDILVHKPSIYMLAVGVGGNWWKVKDFEEFGFRFTSAKMLYFESNYDPLPVEFSASLVHECIIRIFNGAKTEMEDTEKYYKLLCVVISESIRFNEILKVMYKVLQNVEKSYKLNDLQRGLINDWVKLSRMWIMFDLGYGWNPKKWEVCDDVSDPIKFKELLGIIKCPKSTVILNDVKSLPVISDDGKILVGLESIEILLEIVQRGSRDARLEEYVAARDLALFALDNTEALMIEWLKIQSGIPDHDAPSSIRVKSVRAEWLRLDAGISGGENQDDKEYNECSKSLSCQIHGDAAQRSTPKLCTSWWPNAQSNSSEETNRTCDSLTLEDDRGRRHCFQQEAEARQKMANELNEKVALAEKEAKQKQADLEAEIQRLSD